MIRKVYKVQTLTNNMKKMNSQVKNKVEKKDE